MSVGRDCGRISLICCSTFSGNYERDKLAKGERYVGSGGNSLMMNKMIGSKEGGREQRAHLAVWVPDKNTRQVVVVFIDLNYFLPLVVGRKRTGKMSMEQGYFLTPPRP